MKRLHLVTTRKILVNGDAIEAGTYVGFVESDVNVDTLLMCISQGTIAEVPADSPELFPAFPATESDEVPVVEQVVEPEEVEPETEPDVALDQSTDDKTLADAGMSEGLASRLAANDINTVNDLGKFIVKGGDLVALDKVGKMYAKQIRAWWDARQ